MGSTRRAAAAALLLWAAFAAGVDRRTPSQDHAALAMAASVLMSHWQARADGERAAAAQLLKLAGRVNARLAIEEAMEASERLARGGGDLVDRRVRWDGRASDWVRPSGPEGGTAAEAPGFVAPGLDEAGVAGCLDAPWRRRLPQHGAVWRHASEMPPPVRVGIDSRAARVGAAALAGAMECRIAGLGVGASLGEFLAAPSSHVYTGQRSDGPSLPEAAAARPTDDTLERMLSMSRGSSVFEPGRAPVASGQRPAGEERSMRQRRRSGLLGDILHARGGEGVDWELARTRAAQLVLGPPVVALRVAATAAWWAGTAAVAAADVSGASGAAVAAISTAAGWDDADDDDLVAVAAAAATDRGEGGPGSGALAAIEARRAEGEAERRALASSAWVSWSEHRGGGGLVDAAEAAADAWERWAARPARQAWRSSGAAWAWSAAWGLGDDAWALVSPLRDARYSRPEATALRQASLWLAARTGRHAEAAEDAAVLAAVAAGGRVPPQHASLVLAGASRRTPCGLTGNATVAEDEDEEEEARAGREGPGVLDRLVALLRPGSWTTDEARDAARTAGEARRALERTAVWCRTAGGDRPSPGVTVALAAALPPGSLATVLMGRQRPSDKLDAADRAWRAAGGAAAAPPLRFVGWDGRGAASPDLLVRLKEGAGWWWGGGALAALERPAHAEPAQAVDITAAGGVGATAGSAPPRWSVGRALLSVSAGVPGGRGGDIVAELAWRRGDRAWYAPTGPATPWLLRGCRGAGPGWAVEAELACGVDGSAAVVTQATGASPDEFGVCVVPLRVVTPLAC